MKVLCRIERLEACIPRQRKRVILVWVDREGKQTVAADTDPHLSDFPAYDKDTTAIWKTEVDAAQKN